MIKLMILAFIAYGIFNNFKRGGKKAAANKPLVKEDGLFQQYNSIQTRYSPLNMLQSSKRND